MVQESKKFLYNQDAVNLVLTLICAGFLGVNFDVEVGGGVKLPPSLPPPSRLFLKLVEHISSFRKYTF